MATSEVGIRIDPNTGVAFFGIEAVNKKIAAGLRIREIRPGGLVMTKTGEDADNVQVVLGGCQILVVFEAD